MTFTLLSHQWKSFWRGRGVGKSIAIQFLMGFLILYLLASCLVLGVELSHLLDKIYPGRDLIGIYCGLILYYYAADLVTRFVFQELPVLSTQPYLTQNIRRSQLVSYLNARSLFHFLNLLPLFIFLPFIFTNIAPAFGNAAAAAFIFCIVCLTVFNHFTMLYIMRKAYINSWWLLGFVVTILALACLDYFHLLSASALSAFLFLKLLHHPWLVVAPLALALLAYLNNRAFLLNNLYLEELSKKTGDKTSTDYSWLQQWGITGELIGLDIRLILRNKRPKSVVTLSFVFLLYGLFFYRSLYLHPLSHGMLLFVGLILTGFFVINFGRFTFAWQSGGFDGLLAANLPILEFIRAKFLLYTSVSTITYIVCSAYAFLDWHVLPIQTAAFLYNIGCNSVLTVWFGTYSYKRIDLSKGNSFNYEGVGASSFLYSALIFLVPLAIFLPFYLAGQPWIGIAAVGILGLVSFLFRNWWITFLTKEFYKRKHLILQGFREK